MTKAIEKVIGTIKSLAKESDSTDTIVREIRSRELKAVWTNTRTNKEYVIGSNVMRRLLNSDRNDPRLVPALQFVANQVTAFEACNTIERLEALKAFW